MREEMRFGAKGFDANESLLASQFDGERFEELFGQCTARLFRAADFVLRNHHDSEDALQDGMVSAFRHIDQFNGDSQFSTWLFSIVRNAALAKLRHKRTHPTLSLDEQVDGEDGETFIPEAQAGSGSDPERIYAQTEASTRLAKMLESLPPTYRAIIRLCDLEGFSGKEAAQHLGLTVSALKAQHHRARQAIRASVNRGRAGRLGR